VPVTPVATAFTERAQFGIGSSALTPLKRPRVAVVGDEGVSQTAFGALWWTMDRRWGVDFVHLNWNALANAELSRFDAIVIPDGSAGAIGRALGGDAVARLKAWARAGGTLVTMGGATEWAARPDVDLTSARRVGGEVTSNARPAASADTAAPPRGDLLAVTSPGAQANTPAPVPGAMFDAALDRTHWLTFGYTTPRVTALVEGSTFLKLSRDGTNVAVFPQAGAFTRAGFTWPGNTERLLRNTALVVEEPLGRGHVVLFQNDPTFRGWVRSMDRLVLNAVLLGPSF
jgi:hypothetical protein